jgi:SAM-dependent methyltransferase
LNAGILAFFASHIKPEEIRGRRVLEVGSAYINGTVRPLIEASGPREYCGVDISSGAGVDIVCDATELISRFGENSFDIVISTEMLEHVRDWRAVVHALKGVCKPGGVIMITTRSLGFMYHGFPRDYWRFEPDDMARIFSDCSIEAVEKDPEKGVFVRMVKPAVFTENNLADVALYSIVAGKRSHQVTERDMRSWRFLVLMARVTIVTALYRFRASVVPRS